MLVGAEGEGERDSRDQHHATQRRHGKFQSTLPPIAIRGCPGVGPRATAHQIPPNPATTDATLLVGRSRPDLGRVYHHGDLGGPWARFTRPTSCFGHGPQGPLARHGHGLGFPLGAGPLGAPGTPDIDSTHVLAFLRPSVDFREINTHGPRSKSPGRAREPKGQGHRSTRVILQSAGGSPGTQPA